MRTLVLLAVTFVALIAFGATQESDEQWTVSVGGEEGDVTTGPGPDLDFNIDDIPDDDEEVDEDEIGDDAEEEAGNDADVVLRRNKRDVCGIKYRFTRSQITATITAHNKMRALEGAADMMRIGWSTRLARRAHDWATQCKWTHGLLNDCDSKPIGQNLYMTSNGRTYPPVNIANVIAKGWWNEKKFYNYTTTRCQKGRMCGHYTQVVWAKSYAVGCTIVQCPVVTVGDSRPWNKATIFACDYEPTGNYLGVKPYTKGTPCSRCASVATHGYFCDKNKLCRECNPTTNTRCKCIVRKCVRGYFNRGLCKCVCPKGFWGLTCKEKCTCKDVYPNCGLVSSACHSRAWYNWIHKNCAATCPNVCPKPPKGACV